MNSTGILDIIMIYATAFIVLLLISAAVIFRIIRANIRKRRRQINVPEEPAAATAKPTTYLPNISVTPDRMLTSSDIDTEGNRQNSVIENIKLLSSLKRGIMWAEILGRPRWRQIGNT